MYGLTKGVVNQRASSHLGDVGQRPSKDQSGGTRWWPRIPSKRRPGAEAQRNKTGMRAETKKPPLLSCPRRGCLRPRQPIPLILVHQVVSPVESRFEKRSSGWCACRLAGLVAHGWSQKSSQFENMPAFAFSRVNAGTAAGVQRPGFRCCVAAEQPP